ncbi:hypothetical protein GCM10007094_33390 [Pseudovibrio japonicus]|uniref:Uncharacterized protein n=1 Tax=Pseudovibrio japonicus TaxID=366534 RepID=A0ABQ3ERJ7_9HYPH|nr:invasion associated locus B family protein [Pseudovibrio japonicus]GHB41275.1 hypothetical protein GCM10007094_33390 [Pseudovibrio japonicus]
MNNLPVPLSLFAALAVGIAAFSGATPALAQTAESAEAAGRKVVSQRHGDWLLECFQSAENITKCQISQRIVHNETGGNLLLMTMAYNSEEQSDMVQYVLPLDFLLPPGVGVLIGDFQAVARVNRCMAQGCVIEGKTEEAFVEAMKSATDSGRFVMMSRAGKKVAISFSATGFTKAYNEMKAQNSR